MNIFSFESKGLQEVYEFGALNVKAVKEFRGSWGHWAKKTCAPTFNTSFSTHANCVALEVGDASKADGDGGDENKETPQLVPAQDRLLLLDDKGMYKLPPVPSTLKADLAKALATYVSQQWSKWTGFMRSSH